MPRGQMNEAIQAARGLGVYIERGGEWLHEMDDRLRARAWRAAHSMASLVQGATRTMLAGLQTSADDGFETLPALDHSPWREQTPGLELDQPGQGERDRQRYRSGNDSADSNVQISASGGYSTHVLR